MSGFPGEIRVPDGRAPLFNELGVDNKPLKPSRGLQSAQIFGGGKTPSSGCLSTSHNLVRRHPVGLPRKRPQPRE